MNRIETLLSGLNDKQKEAATAVDGKYLVLASSGSGKTRVLTTRIAYLIEIGIKPWEIVGISFTKKSANEIKERVQSLVGEPALDVNMGTFHSLCMRILLQHQSALGMTNMTVLDEAESKKVIFDIAMTYGYMSEDAVYEIKGSIDRWGNEGWTAEDVREQENIPKDIIDIFEEYSSFKRAVGYVDFNDILSLTFELFRIRPDILEKYSKKYKYIMVDEHQDSNGIQHKLLHQLSYYHQNFMLLGDDLQCQPAGTKVLMTDGSEKSIEEIRVGDQLQTFDVESDIFSVQEVLSTTNFPSEPILSIVTDSWQTRYSANHFCYVIKDGVFHAKKAKELVLGDRLAIYGDSEGIPSFSSSMILSIVEKPAEPIYGLSVDSTHTYIADGFLTHNCIYSFRGSNIDNIMNIRKMDSEIKTILLEQNYRSSDTIVRASNQFIAHNKHQLEKVSFTENNTGSPIFIYDSIDESREAEFLITVIEGLIKTKGMIYDDFAVLYRSNSLSRNIEMAFGRAGIPYSVVGGSEFYERDEIKTLVCYLRAIDNDMDDLAFERIINKPKRGIGDTTVNRIKMYANEAGIPFFKAMQHIDDIPKVNKPTKERIRLLVDLIQRGRELVLKEGTTINALMNFIVLETHFMEQYDVYKTKDIEKIQNIQELWNVAIVFDQQEKEELLEGQTILNQFLTETALYTIKEDEKEQSRVTLMTAHASKGLEFNCVFVIGVQGDTFPSYLSKTDEEIEEERRLFYVAMTRAKELLFLSFNRRKYVRGEMRNAGPSRFLGEIPSEFVRYLGNNPIS